MNEKFQMCTSILTSELKRYIYDEFSKYAIDSTGIDGLNEESISFEIKNDNELIGVVVTQMLWGQLHIKYLLVTEKYRGQGFANRLMKHIFKYAKERNCSFIFVETMSFQAPEFYQKFGFEIELKRDGYAKGTSFYYLKKLLT